MSKQVYRDSILEPVVGKWCTQAKKGLIDPFVLEEDGDSGYGTEAKTCIVHKWKAKKGLIIYRNCASSPDLAPIENYWQPPKQYVKKFPHWDDESTKDLIVEGWNEHVKTEFINIRVASMPNRL